MNRACLYVVAAAVFTLTGGAIALAGKPGTPERVVILSDQKAGAVRFMIDGTEHARLDATGLHVRGDIGYGGTLTDTGAKAFEAYTARGGGSHAE